MEALKLLPQSFFDFLARLVPGALALSLFLSTATGSSMWCGLLNAFAAGKLDNGNVTGFATITASVGAYVVGQLAAPFGKALQRVADAAEALISRSERKEFSARCRNATKALWPAEKVPAIGGDYDWLRVNDPGTGALVAKIRAEQTMFFAVAAVLLGAGSLGLCHRSWREATACLIAALACEVRGFTVGKTFKQTGSKLRQAVEEKLNRQLAERSATSSSGPTS